MAGWVGLYCVLPRYIEDAHKFIIKTETANIESQFIEGGSPTGGRKIGDYLDLNP